MRTTKYTPLAHRTRVTGSRSGATPEPDLDLPPKSPVRLRSVSGSCGCAAAMAAASIGYTLYIFATFNDCTESTYGTTSDTGASGRLRTRDAVRVGSFDSVTPLKHAMHTEIPWSTVHDTVTEPAPPRASRLAVFLSHRRQASMPCQASRTQHSLVPCTVQVRGDRVSPASTRMSAPLLRSFRAPAGSLLRQRRAARSDPQRRGGA
jgi:hypothetical protein